MEEKRPGQAGTQYNDVLGEAAGDVSDRLSTLSAAARELGFSGRGFVVGINLYGGDEHETMGADAGTVSVTFQAVQGPWGVEKLNEALAEAEGVLEVTEYHKSSVPIADFVRCFKRLDVSLFHSHINARSIFPKAHVDIEDAHE